MSLEEQLETHRLTIDDVRSVKELSPEGLQAVGVSENSVCANTDAGTRIFKGVTASDFLRQGFVDVYDDQSIVLNPRTIAYCELIPAPCWTGKGEPNPTSSVKVVSFSFVAGKLTCAEELYNISIDTLFGKILDTEAGEFGCTGKNIVNERLADLIAVLKEQYSDLLPSRTDTGLPGAPTTPKGAEELKS